MATNLPLRMDHETASSIAAEIRAAVEKIAASYRRQGFPTDSIEAEITLALGRLALRYGFDLLGQAAANHIDRLEVALAAAAATVGRERIAEGSVDGDVPRPGRAIVRGIAEPHTTALAAFEIERLITGPGWGARISEYLQTIGYQVASMDHAHGRLTVDVIPLSNGNGAHS